MGLFSFFSGKSPEDLEKKGDEYFEQGTFGYAKIEFEKARERHRKKASADDAFGTRIETKIEKVCEALARGHKAKAEAYIEENCIEDARDLVELALELTRDSKFKEELGRLKERVLTSGRPEVIGMDETPRQRDEGRAEENSENMERLHGNTGGSDTDLPELEETFFALCSTLDEKEQEAYHTYGDEFMAGFVALNEGDFVTAEKNLLTALEKNSATSTHIPLELAVCYLNMGEYAESRRHAKAYLSDFPESEDGCRTICETFWAEGDYQGAHDFLDGAVSGNGLASSILLILLKGETFFQTGEYQKAEAFYLEHLKEEQNGHSEPLLRALGRTCQALGHHAKAMEIYGGLVSRCSGCGRMPDFALKKGLAESSFASGVHTTGIVEMFLALVQEDPENRKEYYSKVGDIYDAQGHEEEAQRFRAMAEAVL